MNAVSKLAEGEGHNLGSLTAKDNGEALHEVLDIGSYANL